MKGCIIWLCGLSGSGKSTICGALVDKIRLTHSNTLYLDGDVFREFFPSLGYDKQSRIDIAIKRAKFCNIISSQGINVVCSTISMFNEVYEFNKENLKNFYDVYIYCDIEELKRRDQKNLYSNFYKALEKNIVGLDICFDPPSSKMIIDNSKQDNLNQKVDLIFKNIEGLLI